MTGTSSYLQFRGVAYGVLFFACSLLTLSPSVLSVDSSIFLYVAATGEYLIHPHHLTFGLLLRAALELGEELGLDGNPYFVLRATIIMGSWFGLWGVYRFFRALGFERVVAGAGVLLIAGSAFFWQFTGQTEVYAWVLGSTAFAGWFVLGAARRVARAQRVREWAPRMIFAALIFSLATTLHQAVAIIGPACLAMFMIEIRRRSGRISGRVLLAGAGYLGLAGAVSLGLHAMGWMISGYGMDFVKWMTMYEEFGERAGWGRTSFLSPFGVSVLVRTWFASWIAVNPAEFHLPLPRHYSVQGFVGVLVLTVGFCVVAVAGLRGRFRESSHLVWIAGWILPLELFFLWWAPYMKKFQSLTMVAQVALALFIIRAIAGFFRSLQWRNRFSAGFLAAVCGLVVGSNLRGLVGWGMNETFGPEGDLSLVMPDVQPEDVLVANWPQYGLIISLCDHPNTVIPLDAVSKNRIPDWSGMPAGRSPRLIVHRSSFQSPNFTRALTVINDLEIWEGMLKSLIDSAGGVENVRGSILRTRDGLVALTFGVDPDLPLSGAAFFDNAAAAMRDSTKVPDGMDEPLIRRDGNNQGVEAIDDPGG